MICILTHEYPPARGGAGVYCREMALAASKNSIKVSVWAPSGSIKDDSFKLTDLPWKGSQSFFSSWRLVHKTKKSIIDEDTPNTTLHLAEPGSTRAFIRFGWLIRKKLRFIITIHGSELLRFTRNPVERWLFKKLLHRCSKIHVLSRFNEKKLVDLYPTTKSIVKRIPGAPASGLTLSKPESETKNDLNNIQILCVGRIHPRKGQDQILNALMKLPKETQKKINLCFVGPCTKPKYFLSIKNLVDEFSGKVSFEDDCTDQKLSSIYAKSDIFALTSLPKANSVEGFGLVYLEAAAFGLPIIANQTGGVEDTVINEKTGLLSKPRDLENLTKNFKRLIDDEPLRKKLGANGIEWANSHDWERTAKDLYSNN